MPIYPFAVEAVSARDEAVRTVAFVEPIEAETYDDAIVLFWANSANMLERRGLPLETTDISVGASSEAVSHKK